MLRNKIGFLLSALVNNYNFIVMFSCAYALSKINPYINPSLLILTEIIPGFLTQILYTKYLYKISYTYRWIVLYITQIIGSILLIIDSQNITYLFGSITLVSINNYLGESSMMSLSSFYEHNEMKFWSIGTGLARICGTGFFLLMNYWLDMRIIFGINLIIYILGYSIGLYLLDYRSKIKPSDVFQSQEELELQRKEQHEKKGQEPEQKKKCRINIFYWKRFYFFMDIYGLAIAYFLSYLLGFAYIPLLIKGQGESNLEYELGQFFTGTSIFLGRLFGNYIRIENIRYLASTGNLKRLGWIHLYSMITLIILTICILKQIHIPFMVTMLMLMITYFVNGLCYPIVYNYVYQKYTQEKEWYMGAVGQYTSLFMILGCMVGYIFQLIFIF